MYSYCITISGCSSGLQVMGSQQQQQQLEERGVVAHLERRGAGQRVTGSQESFKSDTCPQCRDKLADAFDRSQEAGYLSLTFQQITQIQGASPLLPAMKDTPASCDHSTLHPAPYQLCIGQLKGHLLPRTGELHTAHGIDSNTGISECLAGAYMTNDDSPAFMCPWGGREQRSNVWEGEEEAANHTMPVSGEIICKSGARTKTETDDAEKLLVGGTARCHHTENNTDHNTRKLYSKGLQHTATNDSCGALKANGGLDCSNHRNASVSRLSRCDKASGVCGRAGPSGPWRCAFSGLPITVVQMLRLLVLLMTVHTGSLAVQAQDLGPRYKTSRRICLSDIECNKLNKTMGEVCWWAWDGCNTGECMCDPRNSFHDTEADMCRPVKYGNERCDEGDRCWEGMTCQEGHCRCQKGTMTSDKMFCLEHNERLLGQQCSFSSDVCYQRATHGYTNKEVSCTYEERCRCNEGYKEDGPACRKWNVNEAGCDEDHHCQGGALCVDNICQCPSRYLPVARDSKCAKIGAKYDLQIGEMCDEINEERYCAFGLVCHQCAGETLYSCVKFVEAEALPYQLSSASHPSSPSPLLVLTLVFTTITGLR